MLQLPAFASAGSTLVALAIAVVVWLLFRTRSTPQSSSAAHKPAAEVEPLRNFTLQQLKAYNGMNEAGDEDEEVPMYVALKGEVFDVTSARTAYGKDGSYHLFAGRDASVNLAKMSFQEEDLNTMTWDALSFSERDSLDNWIETFRHYKCYPVVGRVVTQAVPSPLPEFTEEQLAVGTGEQAIPEGYAAAPILIAVNGRVFDMSFGGVSHYGVGCAYHLFAGRDASRALAKMSFDEEHLDTPTIEDLSEEELKVLKDWTLRFEKKGYRVVGTYTPTFMR